MIEQSYQDTYPHIRAACMCLLCRGDKDAGQLVCQICHRAADLDNGVAGWLLPLLQEHERAEVTKAGVVWEP